MDATTLLLKDLNGLSLGDSAGLSAREMGPALVARPSKQRQQERATPYSISSPKRTKVRFDDEALNAIRLKLHDILPKPRKPLEPLPQPTLDIGGCNYEFLENILDKDEDQEVWQELRDLCDKVYRASRDCGRPISLSFKADDPGLDQWTRMSKPKNKKEIDFQQLLYKLKNFIEEELTDECFLVWQYADELGTTSTVADVGSPPPPPQRPPTPHPAARQLPTPNPDDNNDDDPEQTGNATEVQMQSHFQVDTQLCDAFTALSTSMPHGGSALSQEEKNAQMEDHSGKLLNAQLAGAFGALGTSEPHPPLDQMPQASPVINPSSRSDASRVIWQPPIADHLSLPQVPRNSPEPQNSSSRPLKEPNATHHDPATAFSPPPITVSNITPTVSPTGLDAPKVTSKSSNSWLYQNADINPSSNATTPSPRWLNEIVTTTMQPPGEPQSTSPTNKVRPRANALSNGTPPPPAPPPLCDVPKWMKTSVTPDDDPQEPTKSPPRPATNEIPVVVPQTNTESAPPNLTSTTQSIPQPQAPKPTPVVAGTTNPDPPPARQAGYHEVELWHTLQHIFACYGHRIQLRLFRGASGNPPSIPSLGSTGIAAQVSLLFAHLFVLCWSKGYYIELHYVHPHSYDQSRKREDIPLKTTITNISTSTGGNSGIVPEYQPFELKMIPSQIEWWTKTRTLHSQTQQTRFSRSVRSERWSPYNLNNRS